MPGPKRTRRAVHQSPDPNLRPEDCHELALEQALKIAGGDRRRLRPLDEHTIRVVNPGQG